MVDKVLLALVGVGLLPVGGEGAQAVLLLLDVVAPLAAPMLGQRALVRHAAVRATA